MKEIMRTLVICGISAVLIGACSGDGGDSPGDGGGTAADRGGTAADRGGTATDGTPVPCGGCFRGETCLAGTSLSACGQGGTACTACGSKDRCVKGTCVPPTCDKTTCDGCCAPDGSCQPGESDQACGRSGNRCFVCSGGDHCLNKVCSDASGCSATCEGCCDGAKCLSGLNLTACGSGGVHCQSCGTGMICDPMTEGGRCVGDPSKKWDLVLLSATVPDKDGKGQSWDLFNGLPDVGGRVYYVTWGGTVGQTFFDPIKDTTTPDWGGLTLFDGVGGDRFNLSFRFHIWDSDPLGRDAIGFCPRGTFSAAPVDFSGKVVTCKVDPDPTTGEVGFSIRYKFVPHTP